jgi:hypothetical protein
MEEEELKGNMGHWMCRRSRTHKSRSIFHGLSYPISFNDEN